MSYPDYPKNRLIVNGEDLTEKFGLILSDGYSLEPPSPKTYTVDIPGGNSKIDLTEVLTGNTVYDNRTQEFTFYAIGVDNFEKLKTDVSNFLHGKSFDYKITMDPEYTYHGRFKVSGYTHGVYNVGTVGIITISIDADPYKSKGLQTIAVNAAGGRIVMIQNGRKPVRPKFESDGSIKVICNGIQTELPAGTWTINNLMFQDGVNEVYIRSMDIEPTVSWNYIATKTWKEISRFRWYEWMNASDSSEEIPTKTWSDVETMTWGDLSAYRWSYLSISHVRETGETLVYIQYDWSDL